MSGEEKDLSPMAMLQIMGVCAALDAAVGPVGVMATVAENPAADLPRPVIDACKAALLFREHLRGLIDTWDARKAGKPS